MSSPRFILALVVGAVFCAPPGASAQADSESADSARVLARADSARAALVQPQGDKGPQLAHLVRTPFHLFGATLGLIAATGYAVYQLFDEAELIDAAVKLDRDLDTRGIHVRPDMLGSRSWPGLVVRVDALDPLFAEAGISLRGYTLLRGGLEIGDTIRGLELAAGRHDLKQLHFWGVGPNSAGGDRSDFRLVRREATLAGWADLGSRVQLRVGGGVEENLLRRGTDDRRPDLQDVFAGEIRMPGESDRFARGEGGLDLDFTRVTAGNQLAGARLLTGWQMYRGIEDNDARFQVGNADLRLFAPVGRRHAIALRGLAAETWGEEGDGIPFYHLPALGKDDGLRGFRSWRFRDRALVSTTAEWRYQVWYHPGDTAYRLDGVAFVDHGMVAPALEEIARRDFKTTPGFGLRLMKSGYGLGEVYVSWGGEGTRWVFDLGSTF